jgi:hypothetical protein
MDTEKSILYCRHIIATLIIKCNALLTLVRMALLAPRCRMGKIFECPCRDFSPAHPEIVSEDRNPIMKFQKYSQRKSLICDIRDSYLGTEITH